MTFVSSVRDKDLDRIAGARPALGAYADVLRARAKLALGGPLLDEEGRRIGLLLVHETASRDDALSFAREDPLVVANPLSGHEITGWRIEGVNPDLLATDLSIGDRAGAR